MENLYQKISYIKAATGNLSKTMLNFNKAISMYLLGGRRGGGGWWNKPNLQIKIKQEVKHITTSSTTFAEF